MKILNVGVICSATYNGEILVPDEMNLQDAIEYAKENLGNIPIKGNLEYIPNSDIVEEYNCFFKR